MCLDDGWEKFNNILVVFNEAEGLCAERGCEIAQMSPEAEQTARH